jgi:Uma2 family endonuclease
MKQGTKLTVDEFIAEYSKLPDASRYELQDGEVVVSPEPTPYHGRLQSIILGLLEQYAFIHEDIDVIAPTNIEFSDDTCRGPDITVLLPGSKIKEEASKLVGSPSLIIEIVSPGHPHLDLIVKRDLYTSQKVGEIWFIDSGKKEALFLSRSGAKYAERKMSEGLFESRILKGLKLDVSALFALDRKRLRKAAGL